MAKFRLLVLIIYLSVIHVGAQHHAEWKLLETIKPTKPYAQLDSFTQWYYPKPLYEEALTQKDFICFRFSYPSDGLTIKGYLYEPVETNKKLPVIIYNRGGSATFGGLDTLITVELLQWAKAGYIVIASNLRGSEKGKEHLDEFGGADVNDIFNLFPVIESLPNADVNNIFMIGLSRGGMMSYIALKQGLPVRAAVVIAGPTDLASDTLRRPEFVNGGAWWPGYKKVWKSYSTQYSEHYRKRSAVYWADSIHVPVMIMHSRKDQKVLVREAIKMDSALTAHNKPHELVIYENDGHSLPMNRADRNARIHNFFKEHYFVPKETRDRPVLKHKSQDPVCHMTVLPGTTITTVYKGKVYGFCSEDCRNTFLKNPKVFKSKRR